ncbi:hypothetical protein AV955_gp077 [Diadromus pulchellus ascovirus 4a]|uniref:Complete DpAV4 genome n=1 Tax=Diadromus pulchellus ascovirus 4a TaxID=158683 RepID=F2NZ06_9VIRU|nr:hypothetical protein AV955_gp077 [Diadromus pulchellus ascovirus 4a]CCA61434.1 unnamed protein product [Diadromus pulchellus ascovirus 4a]
MKINYMWHLYIVRGGDGSLYTGIALDVEKRFAAHVSGRGAKYLRGKKNLSLVFHTPLEGGRSEAQSVEYRVKHLKKSDKELIIKTGKLL